MGTVEAKINPVNREQVALLEEKLGRAQGIYFTDYSGLSVAEMNKLRGKFFEAGDAEILVAKNTLMHIALTNKGLDGVGDDVLSGPTAVAIGYEDPVIPAKVIKDFAKEVPLKKPAFKGGLVDGVFYGVEQVEELADIPPVEQLYAQILGSINKPVQDFVGVLNETVRSFVGVIDAIIEKKKAAGEE